MSQSPLEYNNSAIIVWDMQYGITEKAFNYENVVSNIRLLIDAAHSAGIPVIYSQQMETFRSST